MFLSLDNNNNDEVLHRFSLQFFTHKKKLNDKRKKKKIKDTENNHRFEPRRANLIKKRGEAY